MNSGSVAIKVLNKWARGGGRFLRPLSPNPWHLIPVFMLLPMMLLPQIPYLPGWPQDIQNPTVYSISIADLNGDGQKEVLPTSLSCVGCPNPNSTYIYSSLGNLQISWPSTANAPAIVDANDDGNLDLMICGYGTHLYNSTGSLIWSVPEPDGGVSSAADLDDDGRIEFIIARWTSLYSRIYVLDDQGNIKPGWPVSLTRPPGWAPPPISKSTSIGDIDGDGLKEIVVGVIDGTYTDPSRVHCFKPDGTNCSGFPVGVSWQGYGSKAVLADIDGDGRLEIIIGKETTELNVYRYDGTLFPGYPLVQSARGIAVGDIDLDGDLEMVTLPSAIRANDLLSGNILPNFPFSDPLGQFSFGDNSSAPNLCSISDYVGLEIAVGSSNGGFIPDGKLFAFNLSGQVLPGYGSALLYHRALTTGCSVNDMDGNGTADICCGSENLEFSVPRPSTLYCWNTGYPYNLDNVDWAMDGFDLGHTGRWRRLYHINKVLSPLSLVPCQGQGNPCYLPPDGSLIAVDVTAIREHGGANPAGQDVRYSRTLGCGNYEGPVIDHGDGTYTRMLRAPLAACTTDVHAWVNEFKLQDYQRIIFTTGCVGPPPPFSLLSPSNHAANQPLTVTMDWAEAGTTPNPNRATTYDFYFGAAPNPPLHASGLIATQQAVSGLARNTTYFWKVIAKNACGATSSALWAFTTIPCTLPPRPFSNLSPPNGAVAQPLTVDLTWQASTQAASYDVYLGTDPNALALRAAVSGTRYAASGLCAATTYYWQIVARNACGQRPGAVWSFTTGAGDKPHHPRPVSPP
jgi:hypothetical protein